MLVLSWNLFHGRSLPPARHDLLAQFAARLAELEWDVALLQEVPPWWPRELARAAGAEQRAAMTSRNSLLALRRALARRDPELMKSNGGGCNAILARTPIAEHAALRLRVWPERRVAQLARLQRRRRASPTSTPARASRSPRTSCGGCGSARCGSPASGR